MPGFKKEEAVSEIGQEHCFDRATEAIGKIVNTQKMPAGNRALGTAVATGLFQLDLTACVEN